MRKLGVWLLLLAGPAGARECAPCLQRGRTMIVLSYLGEAKTTVKDDAFFCFAAARLSDFVSVPAQSGRVYQTTK